MPRNPALIDATNRAAQLLGLPPLVLKAFMGVEGANVNSRDGVLQVTPGTRPGVIARVPRATKLTALGLSMGDGTSDADLNARFAQAFVDKNLLVQVLTGGQYVADQLASFGGFVALAGLAYNAGPGRAGREVNNTWGGNQLRAALQYHKRIGPAGNQVTVQPGIPQVDAATGAKWTRFPVTANDTGKEIFQYLYLRQVPKRNFGLLDFLFRPALLDAVGLFDNDAPPGEDRPDRALLVVSGQLQFSDGTSGGTAPTPTEPTTMFNTRPLSQRDPSWKDVPLGFPDEGQTIGSHGCTLTCLTMMANGFSYSETPATLNAKLRALGPNQGFFGPLIGWFGVPRVLPGLQLKKLIDCRKVPAPMTELDGVLAAGRPVIVELDMSPSTGLQNHWVLIYAKRDNDYLIHDPWPVPAEASASLTQRYGFAGAPAQIITYVALFDNPNFNPGQPPAPPAPEQLVLVVSATPDILAVGGLALRDGPTAAGTTIKTRLPAGTVLTPQEGNDAVKQKVGVYNQWLNVKTSDGNTGWVAAWLVTSRVVTATKALPRLPARGTRGPIELDTDSAVQPPLRDKVFVIVKKSVASATIRRKPRTGEVIARAKGGAKLEALETREAIARKVGNKRRSQWVKVATGRGKKRVIGYVAEAYISLAPERKKRPAKKDRGLPEPGDKGFGAARAGAVEPDARPVLRVTSEDGLNLRDGPSTSANRITTLPFGTTLLLREPLETAQPKIGKAGTWVAVTTVGGVSGFVSGEFVVLDGAPPEPGVIDPDVIAQGCVFAALNVPLFNNANGGGSEWAVTAGTPLVLLDSNDWSEIGKGNGLVKVRSYAFKEGFARASALRVPEFPDRRPRVIDDPLPFGISAWTYGLHDPFDRSLFAPSGATGKRGWALFTHRLTDAPGFNYEDWSKSGWGVIARLNNDYGGSGTIPTPDKYDVFAAECRRWVSNSTGNLVWVIGNEMNNPREWPDNGNDPGKNITPELYAACFNKVRAAIKSVQPNAIVVPGAVDPFQGPSQSCLDYWQRMMAAITDLDAIALHCYTNGTTPDLVTSLQRFDNDPLRWQYFHFRAYTTFLDAVPPRHRTKPVFVTETDPHDARPWAGGQNGWVQAAYGEIDRWNMQPQAQQIQSLILYRWSRDDVYSIIDKPDVQADIRATVNGTDYRWRG